MSPSPRRTAVAAAIALAVVAVAGRVRAEEPGERVVPRFLLSFEGATPLLDVRTGRAEIRGRSVRTSAMSAGLGEGLPTSYDAPLRRGFDWHPRGSDFTVGAAFGASTLGLYEPPRCPCEVWDQSGSYLHGAARVGAITRDGDLVVWPRLGVAWSYFGLRDGDRQVHGHQTELTAEVGVYYAFASAAAIGVRASGRAAVETDADVHDGAAPVVADTRGLGAGASIDVLVGLDGVGRSTGAPGPGRWLLEIDRTAPLLSYRIDLGRSADRAPPLVIGTPTPWDVDRLAAPRLALHRRVGDALTVGFGLGAWAQRRETEGEVVDARLLAGNVQVGWLAPVPVLAKVYAWPRASVSAIAADLARPDATRVRRQRELWTSVEPALAYFLHPSLLIALGISTDLRVLGEDDSGAEPVTLRFGSNFRVALAF